MRGRRRFWLVRGCGHPVWRPLVPCGCGEFSPCNGRQLPAVDRLSLRERCSLFEKERVDDSVSSKRFWSGHEPSHTLGGDREWTHASAGGQAGRNWLRVPLELQRSPLFRLCSADVARDPQMRILFLMGLAAIGLGALHAPACAHALPHCVALKKDKTGKREEG